MIIVEEIAAVSLGLMKRSMSAFPLRKNKNILKGSSWVQKLCKVIYQSVQNLLLCFKTLNLSLTGRQWSNLPSRYLPLTSAWWGYWGMDPRYPWTDYPRYHLQSLPCDSHYPKPQDSGYSQNQTYYYRNDDGKKLVLLHVIKEANDVVKDVIKETDDVVKGKANVTKDFAKAQRQIYKLISQMPQISAAQMSENMGITNPRF